VGYGGGRRPPGSWALGISGGQVPDRELPESQTSGCCGDPVHKPQLLGIWAPGLCNGRGQGRELPKMRASRCRGDPGRGWQLPGSCQLWHFGGLRGGRNHQRSRAPCHFAGRCGHRKLQGSWTPGAKQRLDRRWKLHGSLDPWRQIPPCRKVGCSCLLNFSLGSAGKSKPGRSKSPEWGSQECIKQIKHIFDAGGRFGSLRTPRTRQVWVTWEKGNLTGSAEQKAT
jgi:hypothetical protein